MRGCVVRGVITKQTGFDFKTKDATRRARNLRLGSLEKREEFMELCSFWTTMIKRSVFIESPLIYPIVSVISGRTTT
jgi:hypothetical protein